MNLVITVMANNLNNYSTKTAVKGGEGATKHCCERQNKRQQDHA